jgi:hypothetical protein
MNGFASCRFLTLASRIAALTLVACLTMASLPGTASSVLPPKQFLANLNASQETPPNTSTALGVAHFTFDESTKMLCVSAAYTGLSSAIILAHIHGPGLPGVAGGILFGLNITNPLTQCVGPFSTPQRADLLKNLDYINVHTTNFSTGEIRGQILRIK